MIYNIKKRHSLQWPVRTGKFGVEKQRHQQGSL